MKIRLGFKTWVNNNDTILWHFDFTLKNLSKWENIQNFCVIESYFANYENMSIFLNAVFEYFMLKCLLLMLQVMKILVFIQKIRYFAKIPVFYLCLCFILLKFQYFYFKNLYVMWIQHKFRVVWYPYCKLQKKVMSKIRIFLKFELLNFKYYQIICFLKDKGAQSFWISGQICSSNELAGQMHKI